MSPKSVQRFWDNDMHKTNLKARRSKPCAMPSPAPIGTSGAVMAWHYSFQGKIATPAWSKPRSDR
ncbi:MAG: hypothetical protein EOS70_21735 [Mesorhizobium sp.]|nr:MAG: hypothetical protein EOS70_21735 [Mesorhizobium sp.]